MIELINNIFGTYTPVTYLDESGAEIIPAGLAGVDWQYITGVVLFAIAFYSLFRIIGSFLNK